MLDLAFVVILHLSLLQLLGRRLPPCDEKEPNGLPDWEAARQMIERAFSPADADEDGRSPSWER